ncbi:MAG TPA: dTDP-4-dehydrorhamnose reductase, partial [Arenimonas sp.]|nr:dTDP-4-dehydrorhamnose reductase [Arenimonas sp.]
MRVLLLGADGQVGHELRRSLSALGEVVASTQRGQLPDGSACEAVDFCEPGALAALVDRVAPQLVVNAAAYTAVDKAEQEPQLAQRINAEAVVEIAAACAARAAMLVHYSTDYVFAGDATHPYREDDATGPLGVYGESKLAGERALIESGAPYRIFRLCWVYGAHGHNFLKTMLRLAGERDELRVVADQVGTPTPAHWIADATA